MTTNDPPNPYAAPGAPLGDGRTSDAAAPPGARKRSRLAAVVVALFAYPLAGAGLWILGHKRRFIAWMAVALLAWTLIIIGVWVPMPKLSVAAAVLLIATAVAAFVATLISKPATPPAKNVLLLAVALIVAGRGGAFAIKQWLVEAFQIPSGAMMPTLLVGDQIYVRKGSSGIARGDAIVFKFPQDTRTDYIKRVVAIGGDTISVKGDVVSVNGIPLDQAELPDACPPLEEPAAACKLVRETNAGRSYTIMLTGYPAVDSPSMVVPEGEVFVMGDNRDNSYDSRKWGTVKVDLIKGKPTLTWWSKAPNGAVRWSRVGRAIE